MILDQIVGLLDSFLEKGEDSVRLEIELKQLLSQNFEGYCLSPFLVREMEKRKLNPFFFYSAFPAWKCFSTTHVFLKESFFISEDPSIQQLAIPYLHQVSSPSVEVLYTNFLAEFRKYRIDLPNLKHLVVFDLGDVFLGHLFDQCPNLSSVSVCDKETFWRGDPMPKKASLLKNIDYQYYYKRFMRMPRVHPFL